MTETSFLDSINSTTAQFCTRHQPWDCHKGDYVKIYCLRDRRWKRIILTNKRMRRYDNTGRWHNYRTLKPLPKEKNEGSVDLSPGTRWVVYDPLVDLGSTNPFEDECEDEAKLDTTPPVEMADEKEDDDDEDSYSGNKDNDSTRSRPGKTSTKTLMTQQMAKAKPVFLKMTTTGTGMVTIMAVEMKTMRMRSKTLMN